MLSVALLRRAAGQEAPHACHQTEGSIIMPEQQEHQQQEQQQKQRIQHRQTQHKAAPATADLARALKPRGWEEHAAEVTSGLRQGAGGRYTSIAVLAEVKVAEALARASPAAPGADGQPGPTVLRTAVCCQLLSELSALCGPLSAPLLRLRDELLPALYSTSCAGAGFGGAGGGPACSPGLRFDRLPHFAVAAQLSRENEALLAQQRELSLGLTQHQAQISGVERQLQAFKAAMEASEVAGGALQAANTALSAARAAAAAEAAAAGEESRRLSAEVSRLREELAATQERLAGAADASEQEQAQWQQQLAAAQKQLVAARHERDAAVALAAARLTPVEGQELEQRCLEAQRQLEEAEARLAAVAAASGSAASQPPPLLDPPPDCGPPAERLGRSEAGAAAARQALEEQQARAADVLRRQLALARALAAPEPPPRPLQLSLRAEASAYFLTEAPVSPDGAEPGGAGGGGGGGAAPPKLYAAPLGLGPGVPAFLRWDREVELPPDGGLAPLERQIAGVWASKERHEALRGPCTLQAFLRLHLSGEGAADEAAGPAVAAAAAAATARGAAEAGEEAAADGEAARAAATGYSFLHACCSHRHESTAAETLLLVLGGQLPHTVRAAQGLQVAALLAALAAAAEGQHQSVAANAGPGVALHATDLQAAVRHAWPGKAQQHVAELASCMGAAVAGAAGATGGAGSSNGPRGAVLAAAGAVQRIAAARGYCRCLAAAPGGDSAEAAEPQQTAAKQLLECALRQHLGQVMAHTRQVAQAVRQQLEAAGSAQQAPPAGHAAWQQVLETLRAAGGGQGARADGALLQAPAAGEGGLKRAATQGAGQLQQVRHNCRYASNLGGGEAAAGAGAPGGLRTGAAAVGALAACGCAPGACGCPSGGDGEQWLAAAQSAAEGMRLDVAGVVAWMQRECLLEPPGCVAAIGMGDLAAQAAGAP